MDLKDKVAVVSGGASGLGRATAEFLVRQKGARVAVFDLNDEAGEALVRLLGAERAGYFRVDVADEDQVAKAVLSVKEKFGAVHVCINCAGIGGTLKIVDRAGNASHSKTFRSVVGVNLVGTFNVMSHCVAEMIKNGTEERGCVINVASGAAFDGQVGQVGYTASKAGIVGMTLPAARELSRWGIRVNAIAPGLFATPMAQLLSPAITESLVGMMEFPKRLGALNEFASLCAYICENTYLNAECLRLDAGLRMHAR